ncbi:hypothetical protein BEL04_18465 [Mucilaginibacter sp. PPCGB 2223]|uniref:hypothetical protein n=1 Tax=Mucilaginibacter sp. PPCGB 2223 TaxID=1886027 RepID=UPI000824971C|nr:hypothetical protein [Mucilaginibacter sp. PPCGB 2223]OCX50723.1 hypothetical protein BEL04_18465 [Mucilaginibacter sp. PPCGB 2223]
MNKAAGIILITTGIVLMIWAGFASRPTEKAKKKNITEVYEDADGYINWPLYTGGFLLVGGITIMVMSKKDDAIW